MAMMQWGSAMTRRMMSTQRTLMATPIPSSTSASSILPSASSSPLSIAPSASDLIVCGRGDKRTKRGKIFKGSFGNSRSKRKKMIERIKEKVEVPRSTPWPLPFKLV